jgi:Domain of unknown function (DUF4159)
VITRRQLLMSTALGVAAPTFAIGKRSDVSIGLIKHDGGFDHRPESLRRLLWEISKRTSIRTALEGTPTTLEDSELFFQPLLVLTGHSAMTPWTATKRDRLEKHLRTGGLLWVDGERDNAFLASAERELALMFPDAPMRSLPLDHVATKSFFLVPQVVGKDKDDGRIRGIEQGGRTLVFMTRCDVLGAYERDRFGTWRYECTPGGDAQRELAFRFGVNLMMVATCLDYKADQVHIDFIMKKQRR